MNKRILEIASECYNPYSNFDHERFSKLMVEEFVTCAQDLQGYSGVGDDGNPYDTPSWNAALRSVCELIEKRLT